MRCFQPEIARTLILVLALCASGVVRAQPSFELVIQAPEPARSLLAQHLSLGRYREVADLDEAELARLLQLAEVDARRLLGTLGFFNPRIDFAVDALRRPPGVTLRAEPGAITHVREVDIALEGDIATSQDAGAQDQRDAVRRGWRLAPGRPWTQQDWDAAKAGALRTLLARRYPRGRIAHSQASIDAQAGDARLGLRLDSGPAFFLGPLEIRGVDRYDPRLIPRLIRLVPGEAYDEETLQQAQLRLTSSGYFDSAFIQIDPEGDPQAAPVQIGVREAPLQRLALGLGLTTDRGPRASLEHRHNRVPGIGWRAVTRLEIERKAPLAQTEWTAIPDADGWRWGVLASAEEIRDGEQITQARRLRIGRILTDEPIDRHAYVQLDRANVRARGDEPATGTGDGSALAAHYLWTGRYFDRLVSPTRGFGGGLEAAVGITLGSNRGVFQRTVLRVVQLLPLETGRLLLRAEGGWVLAQAQTPVPSTQLFRTGGDTSVRGYGFRDIGAERPGEPPRPGRYLAVGSIEWQRPVRRAGASTAWEHKLFADAGLVTDRGSHRKPSVGLGTGLRFASPVGPLQLDLAYGLRARRLRLHLNVGVTF